MNEGVPLRNQWLSHPTMPLVPFLLCKRRDSSVNEKSNIASS